MQSIMSKENIKQGEYIDPNRLEEIVERWSTEHTENIEAVKSKLNEYDQLLDEQKARKDRSNLEKEIYKNFQVRNKQN